MPSEQTHALDGWAHAFLLQFLHDYEGVGSGGGGSGGGGVGRGGRGEARSYLYLFFLMKMSVKAAVSHVFKGKM